MDDLFRPDDRVAQWVFSLSLLADDLMVLHRPMKDSQESDDVRSMISVYRQIVTRLFEARRLAVAADKFPDIAAFVGDESRFMKGLREVYLRAAPDRPSEIERLYEALRHKSVHYPKGGESEIRDLLRQLGHVDARVTARPDGELVAEWTTMTTVLWSLGVQPGSLDWLRDFEPRRAVLLGTVANWGMLWTATLPLYAEHRGIGLEEIIDVSRLSDDQRPGASTSDA